jgi:hypothetical protein
MSARNRIAKPQNLPMTVVLCAVAFSYLLHVFGPLRIADAAGPYLAGALDLARGRGYHDDHMPPGYSHALAVLELLRFGSNAGIVALNLICAGAGSFCLAFVFRQGFGFSTQENRTICLLSWCSWVWIWLIALPMAETLFLFLSSAVLAILSVMRNCAGWRGVWCLTAACILAAAAFLVRTIGAALFVPIAFAILNRDSVWRILGKRAPVLLVLCGAVAATCACISFLDRIVTPWYAREFVHSIGRTLEIARWRISEIGDLMRNVSSGVFGAPVGAVLPIESTPPVVIGAMELRSTGYVCGALFIALILAGLFGRQVAASSRLYFAAYVAVLLAWPFEAVRFWAPVLPLMLAFSWVGFKSLNLSKRATQRIALVYCAAFVVCGSVAMVDSLDVVFCDRLRPWNESRNELLANPRWMVAFDVFGGLRPKSELPRQ